MTEEQQKQIEKIMIDLSDHCIDLSEAMNLIEDIVSEIRSDAMRMVE